MDKIAFIYEKYNDQLQHMASCERMTEEKFCTYVSEALSGLEYVEIEEEGSYGIMHFDYRQSEGRSYCYIPVYGYYSDSEKTTVKLFQKLAKCVACNGVCEFFVHLYSCDTASIQAFHFMQFGTLAEKCIKKIDSFPEIVVPGFMIRALTKTEIDSRWKEIWHAINQILLHLRESPVFYPGTEFTEEVYRDFFMSDHVELIAAFYGEEIVGIIEWNLEDNRLMCGKNSVNVGEIYVSPLFRDKKLSKALLKTAEKRAKDAGFNYMWVNHGTANPNARGFWNKYFETYQYELVRTIDFSACKR